MSPIAAIAHHQSPRLSGVESRKYPATLSDDPFARKRPFTRPDSILGADPIGQSRRLRSTAGQAPKPPFESNGISSGQKRYVFIAEQESFIRETRAAQAEIHSFFAKQPIRCVGD